RHAGAEALLRERGIEGGRQRLQREAQARFPQAPEEVREGRAKVVIARLSDEQRAFLETARRFAREKLAPGYQAREKEGRIDRALVAEMGSLGLIGVDLPEEYGGLGQPSVTAGL